MEGGGWIQIRITLSPIFQGTSRQVADNTFPNMHKYIPSHNDNKRLTVSASEEV